MPLAFIGKKEGGGKAPRPQRAPAAPTRCELLIAPPEFAGTVVLLHLKEYLRDRDGTCVDEIPDGNDHSIDAVRYAVMDDVLRG